MKKGIIVFLVMLISMGSLCLLLIRSLENKNGKIVVNKEIAITTDNFTNPWLFNAVSDQLDLDHNGELSQKEIDGASKLKIYIGDSNTKMKASEINCFPNLEKLTFELGGGSKCLELKKLNHIKKLECHFMTYERTSLICSGLKRLSSAIITAGEEEFQMGNERYQAIVELSKCPALKKLNIEGRGIRQLKLSDIPSLKCFYVQEFGANTLELCNLKILEKLEISSAKNLNELIFTKVPKLRKIYINEYGGETLNISKLPGLTELAIYKAKKLTKLDIEEIKSLQSLSILEANRLSKVMMGNCIGLKKICITSDKKLNHLDLSGLGNLEEMELSNIPINKLDFSKCPKLRHLSVDSVKMIKHLDLSKLEELEEFKWINGNLESIKWGQKKKLYAIDISDNKLTGKLILNQFPELYDLSFNNNQIEELDGRGHKKINTISGDNNALKLVDLRQTNLQCLFAEKNRGVVVYFPPTFNEDGHYTYRPDKVIGPDAKIYYDER